MSEFTTGNLFLHNYFQRVSDWMQDRSIPFLIEPLNERWMALFLEDDWLHDSSTVNLLLDLSQHVPILHFQNAEDHGWGYRIFADGQEQAHFYDDYALDHEIAIDLAEERYPEIDVQPFLYLEPEGEPILRLLLEEARQSPAYQAARAKQFQAKHVQAFEYFGIDSETVNGLDGLISSENLQSEPPRPEVNTFQKQLGITGLNWKSFHYLSQLVE